MDLNAPLGMKPQPRRRRVAPIVAATVVALLFGGFGAYLLEADPRGGEPYAVALIPPPPAPVALPAPAQAVPDPTPTGSIGPSKSPPGDTMRMENGVKVVSPASPERLASRDAGPLVIDVSRALDSNARRTASAAEGLPRTNAPPNAQTIATRPRIAIFVGGMGLNPQATRTAIETMPAAVSLAFVPANVSLTLLDAAKAKGHELLLQLPMQNAGDAAEGPHTLRADESTADIARDMAWLMGRFDGYVGMTNLLGAPVTSSQHAMTAILRSVAQRGLFYLDDGTSRRSVAPSLAAGLGAPVVQADVVLDATGDPAVVSANLDRLAEIARRKGTAIGMASGFPDHLPAIARFAADLDAQGITLVPVSAIAGGGASLATTR